MFPDPLGSSALNSAAEAPREHSLSRRTFLAAGAAGGGLLLSVALPALTCNAKAATVDTLAPNAFVRIGRDGRVTLMMHKVEMGQGDVYLHAHAARRGVGSGSQPGPPRTCAAQRRTLRRATVRRAGNRRLDLGARQLGAAAPRRRHCAHPADRRCGAIMEGR